MKKSLLIGYILIGLFKIINAYSEGNEESSIYLSKKDYFFNFNSLKNLIVFGDSFSSVETNFDDMTYTGKNEAQGDIWPILLAKNNKDIKLWDFAVSGAVIDNFLVPNSKNKYSFIVQNQYFNDKMSQGKPYEEKWNSKDTLFIYWFGTNDILHIDRNMDRNSISDTYDTIVSSFFNTLNKTYTIGARNFMFINELPLEKFPKMNETLNLKDMEYDIKHFNGRISDNASDFYKNHKDANVFVYNVNEEFNYILQNYENFNFTSFNTTYTNNNSSKKDHKPLEQYIWVDNIHLTSRVHEIITNDIHKFLTVNVNGISRSIFINMTLILINAFTLIYILL